MDIEQIILIIIVLGIPAIIFPMAIYYTKTDSFHRKVPNNFYKFTVLKNEIFLSKHLAIQLLILFLLYNWMDMILPLGMILFVMAIILLIFGIVKISSVNSQSITDESQELLSRLSNMQSEIGDIRRHLEGLGHHIASKQLELDEKETLQEKLEEIIEEKSTEASHWQSMTDKQKSLILESAIEAMPKESKSKFFLGLIFGFFVNIMATLSWTLMGNPGKEEIMKKFSSIFDFTIGNPL